MKPKIGIDLDDTAFDLVGALIQFNNECYGTNLTRADFKSHRFEEVWGGTREETIRKIDYFYETKYFSNMKPLLGAVEVIHSLAQENYLEAITARPTIIKEKTERQVQTYFGNDFDGIFHSSNFFTKLQNDGTKLEICVREGISIMIEDVLEYALQFANTGIRVLLFGNYPWNQNGSLPSNIIRVKDWKEVLEN